MGELNVSLKLYGLYGRRFSRYSLPYSLYGGCMGEIYFCLTLKLYEGSMCVSFGTLKIDGDCMGAHTGCMGGHTTCMRSNTACIGAVWVKFVLL